MKLTNGAFIGSTYFLSHPARLCPLHEFVFWLCSFFFPLFPCLVRLADYRCTGPERASAASPYHELLIAGNTTATHTNSNVRVPVLFAAGNQSSRGRPHLPLLFRYSAACVAIRSLTSGHVVSQVRSCFWFCYSFVLAYPFITLRQIEILIYICSVLIGEWTTPLLLEGLL